MTIAIIRQRRRQEKLDNGMADLALTVARITTHVGRQAVSTLVGSFDPVADVLTSPARYAVINSLNWRARPCLTLADAADYLDGFLLEVPRCISVRINYCGLKEMEAEDLDVQVRRYPQAITTATFSQNAFDELERLVRRIIARVTDN